MPTNAVETSLEFASLADSFFSNRTIAASLASILFLAITCCIVHCIWPMHLTSVLVASITETENSYYDAIEAGELTGDVDTEEKLLSLQKKVSEIREDSLRNSLSAWKTLGYFFKGRSITLLRCADEIQRLQTDIEILKETRLRIPLASANPGSVLAMSLRRRHSRSVAVHA
ncbi:hypothetical protein C8J57DRAFT_1238679 [Mycena rebaudengoi]|nr:hypothetical protein C8J57DRAFT_1238679 [Mycena rebaudengoi]